MRSLRPCVRLRPVLLLALFACDFDTSRTDNLRDGEIHARAVRTDGEPATNAIVSVQGTDRVTQSHSDGGGGLLLDELLPGRWVLRISEDDDGDGAADRGAYVPVVLERAGVTKNLTDGCSGAPPNVTTSMLLGDVELADTGALIGSVSLDNDGGGGLGADERARVVVFREIDGYATQVEASAGVTPAGTFRIDGLVPGSVHVVAYVYDASAGANDAKLFGLVENVDVVGGGEALADVVASQEALLEGGGPRIASVQIEAQWDQPEPAAVDISQIAFTAPGGASIGGAPIIVDGVTLQQDERAFVLDPPIGVVEILLTSATQGAADGLLRGVAIVQRDSPITLGPVELPILLDRCVDSRGTLDDTSDDVRDCDRDGRPGLAFPSGADDPLWIACAAECEGALGRDSAGATCKVDDVDFDCDDDADGQPDVTEPARCVGPGVGTDLDSDDACEPYEDPFPYCDGDACGDPQFIPPASRY